MPASPRDEDPRLKLMHAATYFRDFHSRYHAAAKVDSEDARAKTRKTHNIVDKEGKMQEENFKRAEATEQAMNAVMPEMGSTIEAADVIEGAKADLEKAKH